MIDFICRLNAIV